MRQTAGAIFVKDGKVLLGKRASHKASYPDCWDIIGGHVEQGETVEQALVREAQEEVGLTPLKFAAMGSFRERLYGEATHHVFAVEEWSGGEPCLLGDEHTQIGWFSVEDACALEALAAAEYRELFRRLLPAEGAAAARSKRIGLHI
ncbi:MAG TPA: NUDIX hydrolase [Parvibaculum sp.]